MCNWHGRNGAKSEHLMDGIAFACNMWSSRREIRGEKRCGDAPEVQATQTHSGFTTGVGRAPKGEFPFMQRLRFGVIAVVAAVGMKASPAVS